MFTKLIKVFCTLMLTISTAVAGECALIDRDAETVLRTIVFDIEASRVCSGAGCLDADYLEDGVNAWVAVTVDGAARMTVYYIPGCWNKDTALGYVHYSGNNEPYYLKNCIMGRRC